MALNLGLVQTSCCGQKGRVTSSSLCKTRNESGTCLEHPNGNAEQIGRTLFHLRWSTIK